jgi:phage-related protein
MTKFSNFLIPVVTDSLFDAGEVYFKTSDGFIVNLDDGVHFRFLAGRSNHLMPSYDYISTRVPAEHGERLRRVYINKRTVDIPILIKADSFTNLRKKQHELSLLLDSSSLEDEGRLIFKDRNSPTLTNPDSVTAGTQPYRYLNCVYSGGFSGNELGNDEFVVWSKHVISFDAFDPFYYNYRGDNIEFSASTSGSALLPFMPLSLALSGISDAVTVENYGYDVFPTFVLEGPFSYVKIENLTTDKYTTLNYSAVTGETITIDTRVGQKSVTSSIAGNIIMSLETTSSFWLIQTGDNELRVSAAGDDANTTVTVKYTPRFLTAG